MMQCPYLIKGLNLISCICDVTISEILKVGVDMYQSYLWSGCGM